MRSAGCVAAELARRVHKPVMRVMLGSLQNVPERHFQHLLRPHHDSSAAALVCQSRAADSGALIGCQPSHCVINQRITLQLVGTLQLAGWPAARPTVKRACAWLYAGSLAESAWRRAVTRGPGWVRLAASPAATSTCQPRLLGLTWTALHLCQLVRAHCTCSQPAF